MNLFKNKIKNVDRDNMAVEEDIMLLAFMCALCAPNIVKRGIFSRCYAYYVPKEEQYLYVAKNLFEKNGINMQVHYSYIMNKTGQNVLRMNYNRSKNYGQDRLFFKQIKEKQKDLFYNDMDNEESFFQDKINKIREQQNIKIR